MTYKEACSMKNGMYLVEKSTGCIGEIVNIYIDTQLGVCGTVLFTLRFNIWYNGKQIEKTLRHTEVKKEKRYTVISG